MFLHPTSFSGIGAPLEVIPAYIVVHEKDGHVVKIGFKDVVPISFHIDNPPNGKFYMVVSAKEVPFVSEIEAENSMKIVEEMYKSMISRLPITFYSYIRIKLWEGGGEIESDIELVERKTVEVNNGIIVEPLIPKDYIPQLMIAEGVSVPHLLTIMEDGEPTFSVLTATDAISIITGRNMYVVPMEIGEPYHTLNLTKRFSNYEDVIKYISIKYPDLVPLGSLTLPLPRITLINVEELKKRIKKYLPSNLNMFI